MDPRTDPFSRFLAELKRRHVYRVAAVYVVVAWAVIQAATTALPYLDVSPLVIRGIIVLSLAGFPVALVLGWIFDVTPGGIRRTRAADGEAGDDAGRPTVSLALAVVMVLVVAAGVLGGVYAWHAADEHAGAASATPGTDSVAGAPPAPAASAPAPAGGSDELQRRIAERLRSAAGALDSGGRVVEVPGGVPIVIPNIDSLTRAALEASARGATPGEAALMAGIRARAYRRVAILPFSQIAPPGVADWRRAVQDTLALVFRDVAGLEPVPVDAVRAALAGEDVAPTDAPDASDARRVARRVGADLFVTGRVNRTTEWYVLEFTLSATEIPAQHRVFRVVGQAGRLRHSLSEALKDLRRG